MWRLGNSRGATMELISPLRPDECARRLGEAIDGPWTLSGSRPVLGSVGKSSFRGRKRTRYRNSLQTYVEATFLPGDGQTRILCRFGLHPFVKVFMALWFGGVVLMAGTIAALSIAPLLMGDGEPDIGPEVALLGAVVVTALIAFGYGFVRFGRWLARDDQAFLIDFICTTLEARSATASGFHPANRA